jgi:hypothetical protein
MESVHARFLKDIRREEPSGCWGYVVYSTYSADAAQEYTASLTNVDKAELDEAAVSLRANPPAVDSEEPSAAFDKFVVDRFQGYLDSYINLNIEDPYAERIWEVLDLDYIRLPGATIPEARKHFRGKFGWPAEHETGFGQTQPLGIRYHMFVVIDDEGLKSMMEGPKPVFELKKGYYYSELTNGEDDIFVKVVAVNYDEACGGIQFGARARGAKKGTPDSLDFYGWMKAPPRRLYDLWTDVDDFGTLDFTRVYKGTDSVYTGNYF